MGSGLFDEYPKLQLVIGHLGERIPFDLWRLDHRLKKSPQGIPAKKTMREYMRNNVHLTTSGQFYDPPLHLAMHEVATEARRRLDASNDLLHYFCALGDQEIRKLAIITGKRGSSLPCIELYWSRGRNFSATERLQQLIVLPGRNIWWTRDFERPYLSCFTSYGKLFESKIGWEVPNAYCPSEFPNQVFQRCSCVDTLLARNIS